MSSLHELHMQRHNKLKEAAEQAIQNILADTDVAPETTVETLDELRDIIAGHVAIIREENEF